MANCARTANSRAAPSEFDQERVDQGLVGQKPEEGGAAKTSKTNDPSRRDEERLPQTLEGCNISETGKRIEEDTVHARIVQEALANAHSIRVSDKQVLGMEAARIIRRTDPAEWPGSSYRTVQNDMMRACEELYLDKERLNEKRVALQRAWAVAKVSSDPIAILSRFKHGEEF